MLAVLIELEFRALRFFFPLARLTLKLGHQGFVSLLLRVHLRCQFLERMAFCDGIIELGARLAFWIDAIAICQTINLSVMGLGCLIFFNGLRLVHGVLRIAAHVLVDRIKKIVDARTVFAMLREKPLLPRHKCGVVKLPTKLADNAGTLFRRSDQLPRIAAHVLQAADTLEERHKPFRFFRNGHVWALFGRDLARLRRGCWLFFFGRLRPWLLRRSFRFRRLRTIDLRRRRMKLGIGNACRETIFLKLSLARRDIGGRHVGFHTSTTRHHFVHRDRTGAGFDLLHLDFGGLLRTHVFLSADFINRANARWRRRRGINDG